MFRLRFVVRVWILILRVGRVLMFEPRVRATKTNSLGHCRFGPEIITTAIRIGVALIGVLHMPGSLFGSSRKSDGAAMSNQRDNQQCP